MGACLVVDHRGNLEVDHRDSLVAACQVDILREVGHLGILVAAFLAENLAFPAVDLLGSRRDEAFLVGIPTSLEEVLLDNLPSNTC